jgi:serine/threonine protein kinase
MTPTQVGSYRILRLLGRGASGSVFEAVDPDHGDHVALKILDGEPHTNDWSQSLRKLSRTAHPSLLTIRAVFPDASPPHYVMTLVEGPDLLAHVRCDAAQAQRRQVGESPAMLLLGARVNEDGSSDFSSCGDEGFRRAREATLQLTQALDHMHALGLVHCDVRPDNVRVAAGRAMLLDYGLCRDLASELDTSAPVGTVAYMAPEQWRAESITPATDFYALGVTLFESLTGALPFVGSADDVFLRKRSVGAPPPSFFVSGIPEDLDRLCAELMRASPEHRPSADEIQARLARPF